MQHVQLMAMRIGLIVQPVMVGAGHAIPQTHTRLHGHLSMYMDAGVDVLAIVATVRETASQFHLKVVVIP